MERKPFGISPAGEIFQQRLDQAIDGLDGVRKVADDILIIGNGETQQATVADHDKKLLALFERCRAKQIRLNPDKIELKKTSMLYIDHILTSEGVQGDPGKVKAILKITKPTDVAGVRRILGTVNYLAKFLPHLSQISEPLGELIRNGRHFAWEKPHDDAFLEIKKLISTPPVLKYYELNKDLTLKCDASDHGLGTALIQEGKPVAFASWALTHTENNMPKSRKNY